MKHSHTLNLLLVGLLTFQIAWYTVKTVFLIQEGPIENLDFRWFYAVGKVSRQYGSEAVYDLELAAKAQAQVAGTAVGEERLLLPNHPPFVYPVMALLAGLDFRQAYLSYFFWVWILSIALMSTLYVTLRKKEWPKLDAILISCSVLLFEPFFISVLKGQDSYILVMGGLFLLISFVNRKDWLGGVGLGLMLVRPQIGLLLAIPFLFRKQKVWWWFLATATLLGIYCFVQIGWSGIKDYFVVLKLSTGVEGYGWDEVEMFNDVGMIIRTIPGLDIDVTHAIGWIFYLASIIGLSILWNSSGVIKQWHLSLAMTISLLAAPHLHYHDLALLAVPLVGLGIAGVSAGRLGTLHAAVLPMAVSVLLIFGENWAPAGYTIPYFLMAIIPALTWWYETC